MRKITEEASQAFLNHKFYKNKNTEIKVSDDVTTFLLHNNPIAFLYKNGDLFIQTCGQNTMTTRNRLNSILPNLNLIRQFRKNLFLNSNFWDGKLIKINYER